MGSELRQWGYLVIAIGVVWLAIAFNMDTSVATSGGGIYGLPSRVENIGLIAQRQNHLFIAALVTLVGVLMAIFGGPRTSGQVVVSAPAAAPEPVPAPENRDLSHDGYRLWLADTYKISRNEVFDRFVISDQTFGSLEEALAYAHSLEVEKQEKAELKRQQIEEERRQYREQQERLREEEEAKWQRNKPKAIAAGILTMAALLIASPFIYKEIQEQAEQQRIEDAAKLAQSKMDAEAAGLPIMNDAKNVKLSEVEAGSDEDTWCSDQSGTLLRYDTPQGVKDVAAFYDENLEDGRDDFGSDENYASRYYPIRGGKAVQLYASGGPSSAYTSVYVCKRDTTASLY